MTETRGENDVEFEQMDRSYSVVCEGAKLYYGQLDRMQQAFAQKVDSHRLVCVMMTNELPHWWHIYPVSKIIIR